jgi:uncharacterized protein with PIN domain
LSERHDPNEEFLQRSHAEIMRARKKRLQDRADFLAFVPAQLAAYQCPTCDGPVRRIKGTPESPEPGAPGDHDHWFHCRECDVFWDGTHPNSATWRVFGHHPWI